MSASANPKTGLRPFLPQDAPVIAAIFRAAIEELTEDDYNPAQQEAWASLADDEKAFGEKLGKELTLIATFDGSPVGFAALENNDLIDMLYVHPAAAGNGVATSLCDALEKLAAARGATELKVHASDTARDFFAHRGFVAQQRSTLSVGNEWLGSTLMKKGLAAKGAAS
jgi:putative acetyltransferase